MMRRIFLVCRATYLGSDRRPLWMGFLLFVSACVTSQRRVSLSDAEMDSVTFGTALDPCSVLGLNRPCIASSFEVISRAPLTSSSCGSASCAVALPLSTTPAS